jgi:arabinose-5-phosphate isomerase
VALVLSKSGETTELSDVLRFCRDMGVPVVGVTGIAGSALARASTVAIVYGDVAEACRNKLAPTTSTTLTLAIGDALAVAVSDLMGTGAEDFRRYHPGGRLGARLMTVGEVMRTGEALPVVAPAAPMAEVVVTMSEKALGIAVLVDAGRIAGIITDGDLRRHAQRLWESAARDIATPDPVTVDPRMLLTEAVEFMSGRKISACLVTDGAGALAGVLHIHDCIRAGVVA